MFATADDLFGGNPQTSDAVTVFSDLVRTHYGLAKTPAANPKMVALEPTCRRFQGLEAHGSPEIRTQDQSVKSQMGKTQNPGNH